MGTILFIFPHGDLPLIGICRHNPCDGVLALLLPVNSLLQALESIGGCTRVTITVAMHLLPLAQATGCHGAPQRAAHLRLLPLAELAEEVQPKPGA